MTFRPTSRRNFICQSLSVAALPWLTTDLFATNPVGANEKIGAMIMGAGGRGGDHAKALLANPHVQILSICDADKDRASALAAIIATKQQVAPKVFVDMRDGLNDPALDVVFCAAVNHWHTLCGIWALEAGKHVFLEKPVSSNIHEGKALVAAVKKAGKVCQVGTQRRSFAAMIDAVDFVRSGGIGHVEFARGICYKRRPSIGPLGAYPLPNSVDYNLWCGPRPTAPLTRPKFHYDWHWQRLWGNGEIGNNGPHFNDLSRWFLGLDRFPNRVYAWGNRLGYDVEKNDPQYVDAGNTPNTHVTVYDYGDKAIMMECRGLKTAPRLGTDFGTIIYGTDGYITAFEKECIVFDNQNKEVRRFTGTCNHFDEFIEAVRANTPSAVKADARCGALSAALCHLGNIAYQCDEQHMYSFDTIQNKLKDYPKATEAVSTFEETKQHLEANGVDSKKSTLVLSSVLELDPERETFVDNAKANALMTCEYREGFIV